MPDYGAIAQLGERLICIQEVVGSIPSGSTIIWWVYERKKFSLFLGPLGPRMFVIVRERLIRLAATPRGSASPASAE